MERIREVHEFPDITICYREAEEADITSIQELFGLAYSGKYPLEFGVDARILQAEIANFHAYLWLVAENTEDRSILGAIMFQFDADNRLGKAAGGVVAKEARKRGIGATLLKTGVKFLTETLNCVDVIYATTRTLNEGPSKMVGEAGFKKLGLFPNAIQIENLEHLNLDVYITEKALSARRRKPYLFGPFFDAYSIARKSLGLERAYLVTERAPLKLSRKKIVLTLIKEDAGSSEVIARFRAYSEAKRLSNSFFPFHSPNWLLVSEDGGTEVFVWYGGVGKQASILGFRTDRVNIHDLLDSVASALQNSGAAYIELLVDAYDYMLQQEAYTARYIPSAYFPAMRLANDGLRDDYFVLSRTFKLLDFTDSVVSGDQLEFLRLYLRCYYELYIAPLTGPLVDMRRVRN